MSNYEVCYNSSSPSITLMIWFSFSSLNFVMIINVDVHEFVHNWIWEEVDNNDDERWSLSEWQKQNREENEHIPFDMCAFLFSSEPCASTGVRRIKERMYQSFSFFIRGDTRKSIVERWKKVWDSTSVIVRFSQRIRFFSDDRRYKWR